MQDSPTFKPIIGLRYLTCCVKCNNFLLSARTCYDGKDSKDCPRYRADIDKSNGIIWEG